MLHKMSVDKFSHMVIKINNTMSSGGLVRKDRKDRKDEFTKEIERLKVLLAKERARGTVYVPTSYYAMNAIK